MNVIVVAFGPKSATQQAVRRARRIPAVRSVWVVAANVRSAAAARAISGAAQVDGIGTPAVRSIAAELGEAPLLLIHDDVFISSRGMATMLQTLGEGADLVAPHSNEVGTPQFLGALPRAHEAASTVDRLGDLGPSRRIASARHSCLMATARTIASLGGTLVIPGASVVRSHARIVLAPTAVAHDLSCSRRLVAQVGPEPVLVASMIVRDEEQQLPGALESIRGLVDRIEICDTGSVDATLDVARAAGANVRQIEWRNDFGWARNRALDSCRDADFFLHIDADERVEVDDVDLFRRWLKTWRSELQGVIIELRNHRDSGQSASNHRAMRIARARDAFWTGALHESIRFEEQGDLSIAFYAGLHIDHYGYVRDVVDTKGKAARNIDISRTAFESDPSLKTTIDYARSLRMDDEQNAMSEELFRAALDQVGPGTLPTVRAYLLAVVGAAEYTHGNVERAVGLAREAFDIVPREDVALTTLAHAYGGQGRWAELVDLWEELDTRFSSAPMFAVEANVVRFEVLVARALVESGRVDDGAAVLAQCLETDVSAASDLAGAVLESLVARGASREQLIDLVAADPTGVLIERLASSVPPSLTAEVALAALERGVESITVFTTGMAAALIRSGEGVADQVVEYRHVAPADHLEGLADMARRRGRPDLAEVLSPPAGDRGWDLALVGPNS